jgi:hypothetical protein
MTGLVVCAYWFKNIFSIAQYFFFSCKSSINVCDVIVTSRNRVGKSALRINYHWTKSIINTHSLTQFFLILTFFFSSQESEENGFSFFHKFSSALIMYVYVYLFFFGILEHYLLLLAMNGNFVLLTLYRSFTAL